MEDVQNSKANRSFAIDRVGIRDLRYPITLRTKGGNTINTTADISLYVHLPRKYKGTHMSRFVEILNKYHEAIDPRNIQEILESISEKLEAKSSYLRFKFPYFISKKAPVSKEEGLMDYDCEFSGYRNSEDEEVVLKISVPVTTCCPCSKEIADRGAHNQRSVVSLTIRIDENMVWIEDIIKLIEESGSCEVYSLLKRPDEKFVTEQAYDNPRFVEDLSREIAYKLEKIFITEYKIEVTSHESIHNHSAYAMIDKSNFK